MKYGVRRRVDVIDLVPDVGFTFAVVKRILCIRYVHKVGMYYGMFEYIFV